MQISLNLNLIINEVSDSQITSSRQKLADTSARGPRLASAGPRAKPLLVVAGPEWSHGVGGAHGAGVLAAGALPPPPQWSRLFILLDGLLIQTCSGRSTASSHQVRTERRFWSTITAHLTQHLTPSTFMTSMQTDSKSDS